MRHRPTRGWKEPQPCGKLGYRSERHALRALDDLRRHAEYGAEHRREARVYECPHCAMWHTTSIAVPTR